MELITIYTPASKNEILYVSLKYFLGYFKLTIPTTIINNNADITNADGSKNKAK